MRQRSLRYLVAVACTITLLLVACSQQPAQQNTAPSGGQGQQQSSSTQTAPAAAGTFKFGVITPLSGGAADYGTAFKNGITLAVEEINKSGIVVGGKKYNLQPVFCDDEFKSDKSVNCGKKLASEDKVKVIQTPASLSAFPLMGFNQQDGFMLMATSQTPKFTQQGNKLVVRYINNTDRTMGPWIELVRKYLAGQKLKVDRVAVMEVNTELGKSWVDNFVKFWEKSGGQITGRASYDANATDFYAQVTQLLKDKPDAMLLTTVCQPSAIVIKQARELGFKGIFINSSACSGEEMIKALPGGQAEGTLLETGAWGIPDQAILDFKQAYKARFNIEAQFISGVGYDGVRWMAKAVELSGSTDDAMKIRGAMADALKQTKTMFNMANLDDTGDLDVPMYVAIIKGNKIEGYRG